MLPLTELSALSLAWKQTSAWRREYLLVSDSGTHGRLALPSVWKQIIEAACGGETWRFERRGLFNRQVLITRAGDQSPIAIYHPKTLGAGGRLELGGSGYQLFSNFWQTRFQFNDPNGETAITFYKRGWFRISVSVEIATWALSRAELPLLVTTGMVAILFHDQDAAAVSATTAGS